jgi:hypothetical protein
MWGGQCAWTDARKQYYNSKINAHKNPDIQMSNAQKELVRLAPVRA